MERDLKRMRKEKMKAQSQKILENIFDLVLDRVKSVFFLIEGNRISVWFSKIFHCKNYSLCYLDLGTSVRHKYLMSYFHVLA